MGSVIVRDTEMIMRKHLVEWQWVAGRTVGGVRGKMTI